MTNRGRVIDTRSVFPAAMNVRLRDSHTRSATMSIADRAGFPTILSRAARDTSLSIRVANA